MNQHVHAVLCKAPLNRLYIKFLTTSKTLKNKLLVQNPTAGDHGKPEFKLSLLMSPIHAYTTTHLMQELARIINDLTKNSTS